MPNRGVNLPHWKEDWRLPGLTGIYFNVSLREFAIAIIHIFIPIYIFTQTDNIRYVFLFYFIYYVVSTVIYYPLTWLMTKIGPDSSSLLSNILLGGYLFALVLVTDNLNFLFLAAVLEAMMVPLYWIPYHLAFVKLGKKRKYGRALSLSSVIGKIVTSLGPLIGGFSLVYFGFPKVFTVVVVIILLSTIPLFLDNFTKTTQAPGLWKVLKGLFSKNYRTDFLAFVGASAESFAYVICWPLFLYQTVGSFKTVGIISSAAIFLSMLVLLWVGKQIDEGKKGIFRVGLLGNSANWIVRVFLNSGWQFFLADFFYQMGAVLLWLPFDAVVYEKAKETNPLEFLLKRALSLHLGGILSVALGFIIWELSHSWILVFCVGIVGLSLAGLMVNKDISKQ